MALDQKYIDQATSTLTPGHNSQIDSLKNQLAQNQQALEQQKGGINDNYNGMVNNQNLNNKMNKNNVSNAMLGRGLGNSSIAVSGLAEQDAKNTRMVSDIEKGRTNDLNNIDQNKSLLEQNTNNTIGQMNRDLNDKILALAYQLEDRQWDKDFKDKQFNQAQDQINFDQAYKDKQFAQTEQAMKFEQDFKNQQLELQKQAQQYEQQYKDIMVKMEQEKMKFDMGYKNDYLAMQKEAQAYEQQYKDTLLEMQRQQAQADESYRQQQLAFQKEQAGADNAYKNAQLGLQSQAQADANRWKEKEWNAKLENDKLMQDYINQFLNGGKNQAQLPNTPFTNVTQTGSFTNRRDMFNTSSFK